MNVLREHTRDRKEEKPGVFHCLAALSFSR
jgi:hypothetical protein